MKVLMYELYGKSTYYEVNVELTDQKSLGLLARKYGKQNLIGYDFMESVRNK